MSAPVQNTFFENLLGSVGGGSFGQPYQGSGSGGGGFLGGLDFSSILGGGSTVNSGSSGLGSLGSLLGPIGAGLGFISNLIPGLDGFLQNGFAFSCLGSQAFDKNNLDQQLNILKSTAESVKGKTGVEMAGLLNYCLNVVAQSNIEIAKYKSTCSKNLRAKLRDAAQQMYDAIDKASFSSSQGVGTNWDGATYPVTVHAFNGGSNVPDISLENVTPERFENEIKPEAIKYALANNLNPDDVVNQVQQKLFPNGLGGSGGVILNDDGSVDWNVQLGNSKQPNYLMYGLLAVGVLFGYKMLNKK